MSIHATTAIITASVSDATDKIKTLSFNCRRKGAMSTYDGFVGGDVDEVTIFLDKQQLISLTETILQETQKIVCASCDFLRHKEQDCMEGWTWPDCERKFS